MHARFAKHISLLLATIAQALSGNGPALSLIGVLVFWRIIMGVGSMFLFFFFVGSQLFRDFFCPSLIGHCLAFTQLEEITPFLRPSLLNSLLLESEDE